MEKVALFMTSLRSRLRSKRRNTKVTRGQKPGIVSWFSTSDLDNVGDTSDFILDEDYEVQRPPGKMTSIFKRRKSPKDKQKSCADIQHKRSSTIIRNCWYSTSDLDFIEDSSFLLADTGDNAVTPKNSTPTLRNRDSGYIGRFSYQDEYRRSWILEDKVCLDLEKGEVTTCVDIHEKGDNLEDSVSSLLRCTSIQDRSLRVTRKRRQNVAKKNRRNKYSSFKKAIFPDDEGIDLSSGSSADDSCDELLAPPSEKKVTSAHPREVTKAESGTQFEVKVIVSAERIARQNSVQKKSWEIRRKRKQDLQKKRRSMNLEMFSNSETDPMNKRHSMIF